MIRPVVAVALASAALLAIGPAQGSRADIAGQGRLSGAGTSWTLAVTNTGTGPIRCFQLQVRQPVLITAPGTASGWQLQTNGQVLAGQSANGIAPGGVQRFTFPTTAPFPPNAGATLRISETCAPGSDVTAPVTGPFPLSSPPKPKPAGCSCTSLQWSTGRLSGASYATLQNERRTGGMTLRLGNAWAIRCTGKGGQCKGTLTFTIPPAQQRSLGLRFGGGPKGWRGDTTAVVTCKSLKDCKFNAQRFAFELLGGPKLGWGKRGISTTSITLRVIAACGKKRARTDLSFVFGSDGRVDGARSDLNGNDIPDGQEEKPTPGGKVG